MKCKKCFQPAGIFAPTLIQTGYAKPYDLKCPACNRIYNSSSGKEYTKEFNDRYRRNK